MKLRDVKSWIAGAIGPVLLVASLVAWYYQSPPVDIARQYLSEQGVDPNDLQLVGYEGFSPFSPAVFSTEKVQFRVKGADLPNKREVELFRYVYFLPWRVTALREVKS